MLIDWLIDCNIAQFKRLNNVNAKLLHSPAQTPDATGHGFKCHSFYLPDESSVPNVKWFELKIEVSQLVTFFDYSFY